MADISVSATFQNKEEILRKLRAMPAKLANKAVKSAVKTGTTPFLQAVRDNIERYGLRLTGHMMAAVTEKKPSQSKYRVRDMVYVKRGSRKEGNVGEAEAKGGWDGGAWYARLQEWGWRAANGHVIEGTHFMKQAFESTFRRALLAAQEDLKQKIAGGALK